MTELKPQEKIEVTLATLDTIPPEVIYTEDNINKLITEIKAETDLSNTVIDLKTKKGRDLVASTSRKVSIYKVKIDEIGKEFCAAWKAKIDTVNDLRKPLRETLDILRDSVRKPLTDFENSEEIRINTINDRLAKMIACGQLTSFEDIAGLENRLRQAAELYQFNWEEFLEMADAEYNAIKTSLDVKIAERKVYDAEQEELQRLRAEKAARDLKDEEDRKAKEKAEREEAERVRLAAEEEAKNQEAQPPQVAPEVAVSQEVKPPQDSSTPTATAHIEPPAHNSGGVVSINPVATKVVQISFQDLVGVIQEMYPLLSEIALGKLTSKNHKIINVVVNSKKVAS